MTERKVEVKIPLDVEALSKFLNIPLDGEDTETSLLIKQNVVNEFVKMHLKGVLEESVIEEVKKSVVASLNAEVMLQFGEMKSNYLKNVVELHDSVKAEIRKNVEKQISVIIEVAVKEIFAEMKFNVQPQIENFYKRRLEEMMNTGATTFIRESNKSAYLSAAFYAVARDYVKDQIAEDPEFLKTCIKSM